VAPLAKAWIAIESPPPTRYPLQENGPVYETSHQNETVQQEPLQIGAETSKHDAEPSSIPDIGSFVNYKKEVDTLLEMWVSEFYHLTLFIMI